MKRVLCNIAKIENSHLLESPATHGYPLPMPIFLSRLNFGRALMNGYAVSNWTPIRRGMFSSSNSGVGEETSTVT